MKKLLLLLSLLILASGVQAETLKVLFVGNSYTYVQEMPEILKEMATSKGHKLVYEQHTPGGRNFQKHWEEKKAVQKIRSDDYDVVVFQNQSYEPVSDPDNMIKFGKMLAAEADKTGARIIYYLTMAYKAPVKWMKKDNDEARRAQAMLPEMHDRLVESYTRLANETGGEIAPVGIAWKLAYEMRPDLQLHAPDHSHPSETGACLTAMVFYSTLFGEDPKNTPRKLTVEPRKKGKVQSIEIKLDSKTRKALEAAAQEACLAY